MRIFAMILSMKTTACDILHSTKIALENAQAEIIQLKQELASLKEQIEWFTRQLFGKKSEKIIDATHEKQVLLPGMDAFFASPDEESKAESPGKTQKNRRKAKRDGSDCIKLPPGIRVDTIIIDLPEDQKVCSETGVPLVKIGEEITYKLAYTPGSHYIKKIVRFKYVHPEKEEAGIFCPELPGTIFPKCRADDSLLAEILEPV